MMMAVIALDATSFFLWDSYAWINWNLSITGDIPATADGAIFGENPGGHTLHYVKLYPAFRAQAIFSIMLGLLHMVTATLMLQVGTYSTFHDIQVHVPLYPRMHSMPLVNRQPTFASDLVGCKRTSLSALCH
jgi:hypothetical protein